MRFRKATALVVSTIFLFTLTGCGVSKAKYEALLNEKIALEEKVDILTKTKDVLKTEYDNLLKEKMDLSTKIETFANEKNALKGEYDKILDEKIAIKAAHDKLLAENKELQDKLKSR